MRWTDDRLDAAITALDPATTAAEAAPSGPDRARLEAILAAPVSQRSRLAGRRAGRRSGRRIAWRAGWVTAAVASLAAIAVALGTLGTTTAAVALTPPPLTATPLQASLPELVSDSIRTLQAEAANPPARDGQVVRWQVPDSEQRDPVIVPERYSWVWDADGIGHLKATTAQAYSVSDGKVVAPQGAAPAPGSVIEHPRWENGAGYFPQPPPASGADALADYLRVHVPLPTDPDAFSYWGALGLLLDEWTLTPAQHAAALELLDDAGGLRLLGKVTDRLGRPGIALALTSATRPHFQVTVVLDAASRQIIAADTTYLGGIDIVTLPAGSVVDYSAWVTPPGR